LPLVVALVWLNVASPAAAKPPRHVPFRAGQGPAQLVSVEYPSGSGYWFGTYDWWGDWFEDTWAFDQPVCLIFMSSKPWNSTNIINSLSSLGFTVHGSTDGGLYAGDQEESPQNLRAGFTTYCGFDGPQGQKQYPNPNDPDSDYHVRVYAPNGAAFHRATGDLPYMWVGTCHVDVNEGMSRRSLLTWQGIPEGFPNPGGLTGYEGIKYDGASEWVEGYLADAWETKYGSTTVSRDAVYLGNAENAFTKIWEQRLLRHHRNGVYDAVGGKWWNSDGWATVLWVP
jgi:hypothetical protein